MTLLVVLQARDSDWRRTGGNAWDIPPPQGDGVVPTIRALSRGYRQPVGDRCDEPRSASADPCAGMNVAVSLGCRSRPRHIWLALSPHPLRALVAARPLRLQPTLSH